MLRYTEDEFSEYESKDYLEYELALGEDKEYQSIVNCLKAHNWEVNKSLLPIYEVEYISEIYIQ